MPHTHPPVPYSLCHSTAGQSLHGNIKCNKVGSLIAFLDMQCDGVLLPSHSNMFDWNHAGGAKLFDLLFYFP